jgi:hypothetical protein
MFYRSLFCRFSKDDTAAVTIDWVVLTAGIVLFGLIAVTLVSNSLNTSADAVSEGIAATVSRALS